MLPPLWTVLLVGLGGAVGTLARYGIGQRFPVAEGGFPTPTLAENVVGAALLACLLTVVSSGGRRPWIGPLLATGVLGSFTTFSTFATEVVLLAREGRPGLAGLYLTTTLALGLAAAAAAVATTNAWRLRR